LFGNAAVLLSGCFSLTFLLTFLSGNNDVKFIAARVHRNLEILYTYIAIMHFSTFLGDHISIGGYNSFKATVRWKKQPPNPQQTLPSSGLLSKQIQPLQIRTFVLYSS